MEYDTAGTLTLREAAEILGCSKNTVRRKVISGELAAERVIGKYGAEYILSAADVQAITPPAPRVCHEVPHEAGTQESLLESLLAKNEADRMALAAENKDLYRKIGYLQGQVEQLQLLLPATSQAEATKGRPWWRFW